MNHLSEVFLRDWQHIIENVEKTNVPIECIEKVVIKLFGDSGKKQKTINIRSLRQTGLDVDQIEDLVHTVLTDLNNDIKKIDFILDPVAVAKIVQPGTDYILNNI